MSFKLIFTTYLSLIDTRYKFKQLLGVRLIDFFPFSYQNTPVLMKQYLFAIAVPYPFQNYIWQNIQVSKLHLMSPMSNSWEV